MRRVARSKKLLKRGLFGGAKKPPDAGDVGARLARLAGRIVKGAVLDASPKRVTLKLHANASPVRAIVTPDADLEVAFDTGALGPGYAAFVLGKLAPVLDELEYAWVDSDDDVEAAHLAWVAAQIAKGPPPVSIAMPLAHAFVIDAPILTPLGPRDAAWTTYRDAFAWWDARPGGGARARALLAMWHELPWRMPIADEEDAQFAQVHADLLAAHAADPAGDLPYGAWRALLAFMPELATPPDVLAKIEAAPIDRTVGYRRHDLEVELPLGWTVRHPANFTGGLVDDDTRYVATDGERSLELIALTATSAIDSAALLAQSPEHFPVIAREPDMRLEREPDGTLHGLVARAPHVAIVTLVGPEVWGRTVWKSLRPTAT